MGGKKNKNKKKAGGGSPATTSPAEKKTESPPAPASANASVEKAEAAPAPAPAAAEVAAPAAASATPPAASATVPADGFETIAAGAKAEAESAAKAEADAKAKAESAAKAEADAKARAQAEADAKAQAQAEADAKAQAQAEADAKARAQAEADAEAQAQAEADAKAQAQAKADAKAEADAKAQAQAKTAIDAKTAAENEKAAAALKAKADAEVAASVAKAEVAASKARAERERAKALARELAETKNEGGVLPRAAEKDAEGDADSALRAAATQVVSGAALAAKTCFICGEDCSARPRQRDDAGRYACLACVQRKLKEREGKKAKSAAAAAAAIPAAQGRAAMGPRGSPRVPEATDGDAAADVGGGGDSSAAAKNKEEAEEASSRDGPATVLASVIAEAEANSRKSGAGDATYRAPSAPIRPPVTQRTGTVNPAASLVDTAFFQNLAKGVRGGGDELSGDLDTPRGEKEKRPNAFGVPNTPRVAVSSAPSSPNRASPARSVGDPSPAHAYPRSTQNTPAEKSRGTSRIAPLRPPNFPRPPPRRAGVRDETRPGAGHRRERPGGVLAPRGGQGHDARPGTRRVGCARALQAGGRRGEAARRFRVLQRRNPGPLGRHVRVFQPRVFPEGRRGVLVLLRL
jgi:hypothetical protein